MRIEDIIVILCRPSESGNVGAVCRAMKNMGVARLRIVAPERPLDEESIRRRCVHADDIWDRAGHFDRLEDAIKDCALVIGTTRRRGQNRKIRSLDPRELGSYLGGHPGPAAIVFGNERTGLTGEEVDRCTLVSHIPVHPDFPSLNLSHAVQLYTWELSRALSPWAPERAIEADTDAERPAPVAIQGAPNSPAPLPHAVDRQRQGELVHIATDTLRALGFYTHAGRPEQERFFTDLLARAALNRQEADYLEKILSKARRLAEQRTKAPQATDDRDTPRGLAK